MSESFVMCPGHPCSKVIADLRTGNEKLLGLVNKARTERDEWKQAHEDLLAVRQQDISALASKLDPKEDA
jgi:hypothetical protein